MMMGSMKNIPDIQRIAMQGLDAAAWRNSIRVGLQTARNLYLKRKNKQDYEPLLKLGIILFRFLPVKREHRQYEYACVLIDETEDKIELAN